MRRRADAGCGVLLVTHNVAEAERIVDELVVLDRGRVLASGSPRELRGSVDGELRLEVWPATGTGGGSAGDGSPGGQRDGNARNPAERAPFPVTRRIRLGRRLLLTIAERDAEAAIAWASGLRRAGEIDDFALSATTLEDAYLALTGAVREGEPQHTEGGGPGASGEPDA